MKTEETNKLIAEFMGLKKDSPNINWYYDLKKSRYFQENELLYHSDWNWLMEVVKKIFQTDLYYDKYIDFNSSMIDSGKIELSTNIQNVYNQVVEFIKWYNEQNSAKNN